MKSRLMLIALCLFMILKGIAQNEPSGNGNIVKTKRNGIAMTTGLASFSLNNDGYNSYASNTAGENGVYYRRNFGKSWYFQTELNFQRKFTEVPSINGVNKVRVSEKLVQLPVIIYIGNPHKYNPGAINYAFGVGAYITKPFKQIYKSENNAASTIPYVSQVNYLKAGYLFDTVVLFNATENATVSIGFRSTFDNYSIKSSSVSNTYLFRSYSINIGSAFRW